MRNILNLPVVHSIDSQVSVEDKEEPEPQGQDVQSDTSQFIVWMNRVLTGMEETQSTVQETGIMSHV